MLIEEQWGHATGALWDIPWRPSIPLAHGTEAQKERYLRPALRGERRDAYAITEEGAGSDSTMVATRARRDGDDWVLDGEKWHVTSRRRRRLLRLHAHVDGDPAKATVFLVDKDAPGVRLVRTPEVHAHVRVRAPDLRVRGRARRRRRDPRRRRRGVRAHEGLVRGGAHHDRRAHDGSLGARAGPIARLRAASARSSAGPIVGFQAIEFMLADMAAEIMAAKSLLYRVCWEAARGGATRKEIHAMASAVKLVCSETAGPDRRQGRADLRRPRLHAREPVERLWRELRVDRIWEGTSEIQRVVIGNELRKRGAGLYTGWPSAVESAAAPEGRKVEHETRTTEGRGRCTVSDRTSLAAASAAPTRSA